MKKKISTKYVGTITIIGMVDEDEPGTLSFEEITENVKKFGDAIEQIVKLECSGNFKVSVETEQAEVWREYEIEPEDNTYYSHNPTENVYTKRIGE